MNCLYLPDRFEADTCKIVPVRRFLKLKCKDENNQTYYKCSNSDTSYYVKYEISEKTNKLTWPMFDEICYDDPWYYQICGHDLRGDRSVGFFDGMLCGEFLCRRKTRDTTENVGHVWYGIDNNLDTWCNGQKDCLNTNIDEKECGQWADDFDCKVYSATSRPLLLSRQFICNDWCDCPNCADEALTRDQHSRCKRQDLVGMFCDATFKIRTGSYGVSQLTKEVYIAPYMICDDIKHCDEGEDEKNCKIKGDFCDYSYKSSKKLQTRPLLSNLKCSVPNFGRKNFKPVCNDFSDQYNCPDESKNAVKCDVKFQSGPKSANLSVYLVDCWLRYQLFDWIREQPQLWHLPFYSNQTGKLSFCTDSIDDQCLNLGGDYNCLVHKHQMCDNKTDCPYVKRDETTDICKDMEDVKCVRRVGGKRWFIPSSWVGDGVKDCVDGLDENEEFWKKNQFCEVDTRSKKCLQDQFYYCSQTEKVAFKKLCDRIPSCGNEELVCRTAHNEDILRTTPQAFSGELGATRLGYCLPGLEGLALLDFGCKSFKENYVFGVSEETLTVLPNKTVDCRFFFGEPYLLTSCYKMCIDATTTCKFSELRHDSCENTILKEDRLYSVAISNNTNPYISLVREVKSPYPDSNFATFKMFECASGECITHDKVCNLANDCGDWSDEVHCTNQFVCSMTKHRIPLHRFCDGKFDCPDHSDECGDDCHRSYEVIETPFLVISAWILGILATVLNLVTIISGLTQIVQETAAVKIINIVLIFFVGLGDLCVGIYLVSISVINDKYHNADSSSNFCQDHYKWLTSDTCSALGVASMFGSQLSLYSMTLLSLFRVFCLKHARLLKGKMSWKGKVLLSIVSFSIVLSAVIVSSVPLYPPLENYFVNGMVYFNNPMLIGSHDKNKHMSILKAHYGKFKVQVVSWRQIMSMISGMFSMGDNNRVIGTKLNFYGNSGVCLFKFFVRQSDPQRGFVWFVIILNAVCFLVICVSYSAIYITVANSARRVSKGTIGRKSSTNSQMRQSQKKQSNRNVALNRKIALMILTDFLCWIPFVLLSSAHYLGVLDATSFYSFFSIIVLPLNSVINPLLYNNSGVLDFIGRQFGKLATRLGVSQLLYRGQKSDLVEPKVQASTQVAVNPAAVEVDINTPREENEIKRCPDTAF